MADERRKSQDIIEARIAIDVLAATLSRLGWPEDSVLLVKDTGRAQLLQLTILALTAANDDCKHLQEQLDEAFA